MRGDLRLRDCSYPVLPVPMVGPNHRLLAKLPMTARRRVPTCAAVWIPCVLTICAPARAQAIAREPKPVFEPWHEGEPIPAGYKVAKRSRETFVLAGSLLLGISSAINLIGVGGNALLAGPSRENWLLVPGVGPLVLMAETTNAPGNVALAMDALAAFGGIAMMTYGLASPIATLVRDESVPAFAFTPMVGIGSAGAYLVGQF